MILVFGGTTGGLGVGLHKSLAGLFFDSQVTLPVGRKECELESEESIQGFLSKVGQNNNSPLHIVNATGVSVSAMIHKSEILDINRMLRINLVANMLLLKHARELYKKHGGSFTVISSITAKTGPAGTGAYTASKAGLEGLVIVAAKEMARVGARVNLIELGYCDVGMISQVSNVDDLILTIPLGRLGRATDVAEACRFLIQCEYITGATIKLNGGLA